MGGSKYVHEMFPPTPREELKFSVPQEGVLRRIFGSKIGEMTRM